MLQKSQRRVGGTEGRREGGREGSGDVSWQREQVFCDQCSNSRTQLELHLESERARVREREREKGPCYRSVSQDIITAQTGRDG